MLNNLDVFGTPSSQNLFKHSFTVDYLGLNRLWTIIVYKPYPIVNDLLTTVFKRS